MKNFLTLILLLLLLSPAYGLNGDQQDVVKNFKRSLENKEEVVRYVRLPLIRKYPVPDIKTQSEMLKRYSEIFDSKFVNYIVRSSISRDWHAVGDKGIKLKNGMLWLDYEGRVIGVNYQTSGEKRKRQQMISRSKSLIHSSLRSFVQPVITWKTRNFIVRIDKVGGGKYRYAAWSSSKDRIDKPNLVISGKGSGNYYEFKSGPFVYKCYLKNIKSSRDPKGDLKVFKNGRLQFHEKVILILKP